MRDRIEKGKSILITGATGLVGSYLTLIALRAHFPVCLLIHKKEGLPALNRLQKILNFIGASLEEWNEWNKHLFIYEGDITLPLFGLSTKEWNELAKGVSRIYHAAAYINFKEEQRLKSFRVNVEGTRQVLALLESSGAHLFHISTAYVAGKTDRCMFEQEIEEPQLWRNPYEETKYLSEKEVVWGCRKKGLDYTIFRPSILIGDTTTGCILQFNTIYSFMKLFYHQTMKREGPSPLILKAKPEATLNLIPVDYAIKSMWRISCNPICKGKIFHITNPSPLRFKDLIWIGEKIFGKSIKLSEDPSSLIKIREGENEKETSLYTPYMFGEPTFDLKNTQTLLPDYNSDFPSLDEAYFRKIITFAVERNWKPFSLSEIQSLSLEKPIGVPEKYFKEFLFKKLHQPLLKNLKNLNVIFSIQIKDGIHSKWTLEIKDGMLVSISQNEKRIDCYYTMDAITFEKVVRGLYPPEEAFFDGHIDIQGNMEKALSMGAVLSEFCKTYPYQEKIVSKDIK